MQLLFERSQEPLDDGNRTVLVDGTVAAAGRRAAIRYLGMPLSRGLLIDVSDRSIVNF